MSKLPIRQLKVRIIRLGHSRVMVLPAWWLKLNHNPTQLELGITLDSVQIKPLAKEEQDEPRKELKIPEDGLFPTDKEGNDAG